MDQSKKTMRHFYCRDVMWETFEQMANDFDCSIDYLINEAMRYYSRSKNYQSSVIPRDTARNNDFQPNRSGMDSMAPPTVSGHRGRQQRAAPAARWLCAVTHAQRAKGGAIVASASAKFAAFVGHLVPAV